jgi:hypothetical protein
MAGDKKSFHLLSPEQARQDEVEGSEATLSKSKDGLKFSVTTSRLTPGNAYTVWIMAFNNPEACGGNNAPPGHRCGPDDMGNPEAGFSLMFGAGKLVDGESETFEGSRTQGDRSGVEVGDGLTDAGKAEIHLRVRDHGPAQAGFEKEQITTIGGGCTDESVPIPGGSGKRGNYNCRDVQTTGI